MPAAGTCEVRACALVSSVFLVARGADLNLSGAFLEELLPVHPARSSCRLRFGTPGHELLSSVLNTHVQDDADGVGWEETVEAAATQVLRTALARSARDAAVPPPQLPTCSGPRRDNSRLKRYLTLILERLAETGTRGGCVLPSLPTVADNP